MQCKLRKKICLTSKSTTTSERRVAGNFLIQKETHGSVWKTKYQWRKYEQLMWLSRTQNIARLTFVILFLWVFIFGLLDSKAKYSGRGCSCMIHKTISTLIKPAAYRYELCLEENIFSLSCNIYYSEQYWSHCLHTRWMLIWSSHSNGLTNKILNKSVGVPKKFGFTNGLAKDYKSSQFTLWWLQCVWTPNRSLRSCHQPHWHSGQRGWLMSVVIGSFLTKVGGFFR